MGGPSRVSICHHNLQPDPNMIGASNAIYFLWMVMCCSHYLSGVTAGHVSYLDLTQKMHGQYQGINQFCISLMLKLTDHC
jgi:hypothetical protein